MASEQVRIEYTYPYLENQGQTAYTPAFDTIEQAIGHMQNDHVTTVGYGRVVSVQKRTVSDWTTDLDRTDLYRA